MFFVIYLLYLPDNLYLLCENGWLDVTEQKMCHPRCFV